MLLVIMAALSNIGWTLVFLPVAMALALGFGLGLGFIVSVLNARYRDVKYLVGILLNVAFFAVPIVYTPELLESEKSRRSLDSSWNGILWPCSLRFPVMPSISYRFHSGIVSWRRWPGRS